MHILENKHGFSCVPLSSPSSTYPLTECWISPTFISSFNSMMGKVNMLPGFQADLGGGHWSTQQTVTEQMKAKQRNNLVTCSYLFGLSLNHWNREKGPHWDPLVTESCWFYPLPWDSSVVENWWMICLMSLPSIEIKLQIRIIIISCFPLSNTKAIILIPWSEEPFKLNRNTDFYLAWMKWVF